MKLTIERGALLRSLAHVQSVVERRNTIPILSNILIEGDKGGLSMTATDMDLTIVERAEAAIGKSGATTVPAHTLYDIVRVARDKGILCQGRGSAAAAVLGAVAGGLLGNIAEHKGTSKDALEITVKLDSGELRAIVQEADVDLQPGQRVRLLSSGGVTRVAPVAGG